jgi:hypothetical protein
MILESEEIGYTKIGIPGNRKNQEIGESSRNQEIGDTRR